MPRNEHAPGSVDAPTPSHPRAFAFDSVPWRQIVLNVAYVLVAGPRGLAYLLVLAAGLALDLLHLALRLLLAGSLGLLYTALRAMSWLLRYGLRFVWVGTVVALVWVVQTLWWLVVASCRALVGVVWTVLVDLVHPRSAWQRAVGHMRRERVRAPRPIRDPSAWALSLPLRWSGGRIVDTGAAAMQRFRPRLVPERWLIVPLLWWYLALWEHRHTTRWLDVDLPPLEAPSMTPADRRALRHRLPLASLGYLLAKLPLGLLAIALVVGAVAAGEELITSGNDGIAILVGLLTIYALHLLALASARLARHAFSPSSALRRLLAAEALAAQERGKAERAEQSRRDLIINVGHELRTPTASILGHVESVLLALDGTDGQVPPATLRSYLGIVQREAERLSSLVDDLLAVARAEHDELQLVVAPIDAAAVVNEVYEALAPLARREREVLLVQETQPSLPALLADRQRLTQVLLNLVRNAITYTPAGGIVSIALCQANDTQLQFSVADTGSGIAPNDLQRVFERFYRADASRTRSSGGFGLGLAIARDLVEAMGGTITAESVLGEGSCFHVWLPIATSDQG